jgi:sporulation protein YlmC with PRC-barrel domain
MTINTSDVAQLRGLQLIDSSGDKIGKIDEIYLDEQTGQPEWLAVNTGLFGSNVSFVPLAEATNEGDSVRVPYEKSQSRTRRTRRRTAALPGGGGHAVPPLRHGVRREQLDSGLPRGRSTRRRARRDRGDRARSATTRAARRPTRR